MECQLAVAVDVVEICRVGALLVEFGDVVNDTLPLVVDTRLLKVVFKGDVKVEAAAFQNKGIGIALMADNSS